MAQPLPRPDRAEGAAVGRGGGRRRPPAGARHPERRPLSDVPRHDDRQRRAGRRAVEPARRRLPAAVGGQRLRPHLRQPHARRGHPGRPARAQAGDARRPGGVLRRLAGRRPGAHVDAAHRGARASWAWAPRPANPAPSRSSATSTPSAARARALGVWAAVAGLALAMGPVIGGVLVGIGGWRAVFWFNVGAGAAVLLAAAAIVPESADPQAAASTCAGFVLGPVALGDGHLRRDPRRDDRLRGLVGDRAVRARRRRRRRLRLVERRSRAPMLDLALLAPGGVHRRRSPSRSPPTSASSRSSSSPRCTCRRSSATPPTARRRSSCPWRSP